MGKYDFYVTPFFVCTKQKKEKLSYINCIVFFLFLMKKEKSYNYTLICPYFSDFEYEILCVYIIRVHFIPRFYSLVIYIYSPRKTHFNCKTQYIEENNTHTRVCRAAAVYGGGAVR